MDARFRCARLSHGFGAATPDTAAITTGYGKYLDGNYSIQLTGGDGAPYCYEYE